MDSDGEISELYVIVLIAIYCQDVSKKLLNKYKDELSNSMADPSYLS